MGVHGKHEDYGSYRYLKAPRDFREFDLVEGEGPFPSYLIPLSSEKEKSVQDLAERTIIGMAIDCSHSSPRTTPDTIEASVKPIFVTHTGARSVWNIKRLATDEMMKACEDNAGTGISVIRSRPTSSRAA
jgi:hypothetical protein